MKRLELKEFKENLHKLRSKNEKEKQKKKKRRSNVGEIE